MKYTEKTSGEILEFYQKAGDEKFSFRVQGNKPLTEELIKSVKQKRVRAKDIRFAVPALLKKIQEITARPNYEIWADEEGIPVDKPEIVLHSPQEVRNWLNNVVYQSAVTNEVCGNGHSVWLNGKKIPLDHFFSDDDFYSARQWEEIVKENFK